MGLMTESLAWGKVWKGGERLKESGVIRKLTSHHYEMG